MTDQQTPQSVPTAWVKVEVHNTVRRNAHVIKQHTGLRLQDIYRLSLHFVLYFNDPENAVEFFKHILHREVNSGTEDQNRPE